MPNNSSEASAGVMEVKVAEVPKKTWPTRCLSDWPFSSSLSVTAWATCPRSARPSPSTSPKGTSPPSPGSPPGPESTAALSVNMPSAAPPKIKYE